MGSLYTLRLVSELVHVRLDVGTMSYCRRRHRRRLECFSDELGDLFGFIRRHCSKRNAGNITLALDHTAKMRQDASPGQPWF